MRLPAVGLTTSSQQSPEVYLVLLRLWTHTQSSGSAWCPKGDWITEALLGLECDGRERS